MKMDIINCFIAQIWLFFFFYIHKTKFIKMEGKLFIFNVKCEFIHEELFQLPFNMHMKKKAVWLYWGFLLCVISRFGWEKQATAQRWGSTWGSCRGERLSFVGGRLREALPHPIPSVRLPIHPASGSFIQFWSLTCGLTFIFHYLIYTTP